MDIAKAEESKPFKFYVTHVEPLNGSLLNIWGQTFESYSICKNIEAWISQSTEQLDASLQSVPKSVEELSLNTVVLAKYQNERYQRARVVNARRTDGLVQVQLHFIDYGYFDLALLKDIRLLVSPEYRKLRDLWPLALEFVLCNVSSTFQVGWGNNLSDIRNSLCGKSMEARITGTCERRRLIDLNINGQNVSSYLINHQVAHLSNVASILQKYEKHILILKTIIFIVQRFVI